MELAERVKRGRLAIRLARDEGLDTTCNSIKVHVEDEKRHAVN